MSKRVDGVSGVAVARSAMPSAPAQTTVPCTPTAAEQPGMAGSTRVASSASLCPMRSSGGGEVMTTTGSRAAGDSCATQPDNRIAVAVIAASPARHPMLSSVRCNLRAVKLAHDATDTL